MGLRSARSISATRILGSIAAGHADGDSVLELENVGQVTLKPVGPKMCTGGRIDELTGDPHARRGLAHAALQHVAHAEFAPDLPDVTATCPCRRKLELRAMTNSQRMRDSAVMMSSTMPSAKYSCSGSPLMFWNGSTAIDGLSGSGSAGARARRAQPDPEHPDLCAMFFSSGLPRSSTSSAILPAASSRTRAEMQMPPGSASGSSRAAMITPSPSRSSPSATTSP